MQVKTVVCDIIRGGNITLINQSTCLNDVLKLLKGLKINKITPNGNCNRRPVHESFNKLYTANTPQLLMNFSMHIMEKAFGNNQCHSWGFGHLGQVNTKVTPNRNHEL